MVFAAAGCASSSMKSRRCASSAWGSGASLMHSGTQTWSSAVPRSTGALSCITHHPIHHLHAITAVPWRFALPNDFGAAVILAHGELVHFGRADVALPAHQRTSKRTCCDCSVVAAAPILIPECVAQQSAHHGASARCSTRMWHFAHCNDDRAVRT